MRALVPLAAVLALSCAARRPVSMSLPTSAPTCPSPDQLLTNEYADEVPGGFGIHVSPYWDATCGSLFLHNGNGFTGSPVDGRPVADRDSVTSNNSAQLRLLTKEQDFGNVQVSFALLNEGLSVDGGSGLPDQVYDGVHVFLRWQSQFNLYAASINLRSGTAVVKRKYPGGPDPSNGGTYYELAAPVVHAVPYGRWQSVQASVRTLDGGAVEVTADLDGQRVLDAFDYGAALPDGGHVPPITGLGAVGLRGDNCQFEFAGFTVTGI